jgi:mannose-6-phosphate isomerase-like protein (cupin superfamily)
MVSPSYNLQNLSSKDCPMKITTKLQAVDHKNSNNCIVTEYNLGVEMIDFAIARVTGRYPDRGHALNTSCQEMAYVNEGSGKICINGKDFSIQTGDLVLIDPQEKFYWEGTLTLHITCRPAWSKEQHQIID